MSSRRSDFVDDNSTPPCRIALRTRVGNNKPKIEKLNGDFKQKDDETLRSCWKTLAPVEAIRRRLPLFDAAARCMNRFKSSLEDSCRCKALRTWEELQKEERKTTEDDGRLYLEAEKRVLADFRLTGYYTSLDRRFFFFF